MTDVFLPVLPCAFVLLALWAIWLGICNERTYAQRKAILDDAHTRAQQAINDRDWQWRRFYDAIEEVSYSKHFWHLMTFRDPKKLYRKGDAQ